MSSICPFHYVIVASDEPDLLPSPSFIKHYVIGIGTVLDLTAQHTWIAPDTTACRLHLTGRHWPSAVAVAADRGLILPTTAFYICRRPHKITPADNTAPIADIKLDPGGVVVDHPVVNGVVAKSHRRWRCESSSTICAGLGHGRAKLEALLPLPGDDHLRHLIGSSAIRSAIVYSPAGNGKRTRIQRAAINAGLAHITISIPDLFADRLADPVDALRSRLDSARSLRPVVITLQTLSFALDRDDVVLCNRLRRLLRQPPDDVTLLVPAAERLPAEFEDAAHDIVTLGLPEPSAILGATTHARSIADLIALQRRAHRSSLATAIAETPPAALLDVVVAVPDVRWEDIGGLDDTIVALQQLVQWPLENAAAFAALGMTPLKGCLLYGPPGTGKTLLAQAVATQSRASFVAVAIADLIRGEVGASEAFLRETFARARAAAPCVVFFDEFQAMFTDRDADSSPLLAQLLAELDASPPGVIVLAATNRPDLIDTALLRPGRFDRVLFVPPPDLDGRAAVLDRLRRKSPFSTGVDCAELARKTEGFTGADLQFLVQKAGLCALQRDEMATQLEQDDFQMALRSGCTASVNDSVMHQLQTWRDSLSHVKSSYDIRL